MMIGLLGLFIKLSLFSLIAFGGVNALLPTLYDISVNQEKWIDADTFIHYFAIAQAAPGPNLLTVTLIGWNAFGLAGALLATLAVCWPSCILIFYLQRVLANLQHIRWKKTIEYSAGALAVGLVLASAWQIAIRINGNAMVVKPINNEVDVRFIEYFFRGAVDLSRAITGAAQPQITRQSLSPIVFKYPPRATQQKIVAKLDAIFAEIDKATVAAEDNTKNAEALFQSYLSKIIKKESEIE